MSNKTDGTTFWKTEFENDRFPFGKYAGWKMKDIPGAYRNLMRARAKEKIPQGFTDWQMVLDAFAPFEAEDAKINNIRDKEKSQHVGTVGEEYVTTVTCVETFPINGNYGERQVYVFQDENGNVIKSFDRGCPQEPGMTRKVICRIKAHETYQGERQTIVDRMRLAP